MSDLETAFAPFRRKMEEAGLHPRQVERFRRLYEQLYRGGAPVISGRELVPPQDLPRATQLPPSDGTGLSQVVIIKLNGGLGTSMGLAGPKSLLPVKEGLTFLDLVARQVLHQRERLRLPIPILFMNSFATREPTLEALARYPELPLEGLPLDFLQSRVPKVLAETLAPAEWPADPRLEWCPPGHGDIYLSLDLSGLLGALLERGYRYAMVSNIDNLGATLEPSILAWFACQEIPFLMEVTRRTPADRKGGHLAVHRKTGRLVLRELAQCPAEEREEFQDIERFRYFNTNNLWLDLEAVRNALEDGLHLPLIANSKTLDPRDPATPRVFQLETAMGAAISCFPGARALEVGRHRFSPVKTTADLLAVWSDAYRLDEEWRVVLHPSRSSPPELDLDPAFYRFFDQLRLRFPRGAPSLRECTRLVLEGDVRFGEGVRVKGEVLLRGPSEIPDGAVLEGTTARTPR